MSNPTLVLKNQFGEESINKILAGSDEGLPVAASTIMSNLTLAAGLPIANTYADVSAKLLPTQLLTGYVAGAGTVLATDTVIQGMQKLDRVATHQADSVAIDVAGIVADFNALLLKLQNAGLMA